MMFAQDKKEKFYGREDISFLLSSSIASLFPLPSGSKPDSTVPKLAPWLAYIFHRTGLPNQTIFHAIHLLRRVATTYNFSPLPSSPFSPLVYHRLALSAIILATNYWMDDAYSSKSWSIASKGVFEKKEIDGMMIEMMEILDWRIGEGGVKGILDVLEEYEKQFNEWVESNKTLLPGNVEVTPFRSSASPSTPTSPTSDSSSVTLITEEVRSPSDDQKLFEPPTASSVCFNVPSTNHKRRSSVWNHLPFVSTKASKCGGGRNSLGNLVSFH